MLSEKAIDRINGLLKDNTFNYTGEIISTINGNIDFKIELLGYRNMIRVGEPYPYMRVKITITDIKDRISRLILLQLKKVEKEDILRQLDRNMWTFKRGVQNYLSSVLQFFDTENYENVVIDEFVFDYDIDEDELVRDLREQKVPTLAIRTVIRDIVTVLKSGKTDEIMLPYGLNGQESYEIMNFPEFDVFLDVRQVDFEEIKSGADFLIQSGYVSEGQQLQILIQYVPDRLQKSLHSIVGNLNDDIAHELQHLRQDVEGRLDITDYKGPNVGYFLQPDEIEAQYRGLKRKSKIMRLPMIDVVDDWFENNSKRFRLSDKDVSKIKSAIMRYPKKKIS
jgi:hypothetical protein